jgi:hypothetical protein
MKNKLIFSSLLCFGAIGSINAANTSDTDGSYRTSFDLYQGYRDDSLNLRAGEHHNRHTKYKELDTWTTRVGFKLDKQSFFLKGYAGYGDIYHGRVRHHGGHNHNHGRHHKVNGDYTLDFALYAGKDFNMDNGWYVAPTLGYGVYFQDIHARRHHHGHHNKNRVRALWYSPQVGVCVKKTFNDNWNAFFSYNFLYPLNFQVTHKGNHGHKHHRTQENQAYRSVGNLIDLGVEWKFHEQWSLRPEIEVMEFYSRGAKNSGHRSHDSKRAHRASIEYRIALGYAF